MRAFTWNRDSHRLFDYESQSVTKRTFKVRADSRVLRHGNEVKLVDLPRDDMPGEHLLSILGHPTDYRVTGRSITAQDGVIRNDDVWLVVRSLKNQDGKIVSVVFLKFQNYKLRKNDVIKLGRVKFRIKDLFIPGVDGDKREID